MEDHLNSSRGASRCFLKRRLTASGAWCRGKRWRCETASDFLPRHHGQADTTQPIPYIKAIPPRRGVHDGHKVIADAIVVDQLAVECRCILMLARVELDGKAGHGTEPGTHQGELIKLSAPNLVPQAVGVQLIIAGSSVDPLDLSRTRRLPLQRLTCFASRLVKKEDAAAT